MDENPLLVSANERLRTAGVYGGEDQISPFLEPRDNIALLLSDPVEQLEATILQVENKQLASSPRLRFEYRTVVYPFASDPDALKAPTSDIDDRVELGDGLDVIGPAG